MTVSADDQSDSPSERISARFIVGAVVFVLGFASPALIPLVVASGLPAGVKTALSGALVVGIPEIAAIVAVAIMGRQGFNDLKRMIWGLFRKVAPPARVSRTRYRIGLIMFVLPLLYGWAGPYLSAWIPEQSIERVWLAVLGDVFFIASFFVLGGEFWEKVRALFMWSAKIVIAPLPHSDSSQAN